jgi:hypothetical protein
MLFFANPLLMSTKYYLGSADQRSVTLLGAALFLPYVCQASLVVGTCSLREACRSAW